MPRLIAGALAAAAVWPVWPWYIARLIDGSDDPWCLVALLTAIMAHALVPSRLGTHSVPVQLGRSTILLLLYTATVLFLPPIFRCAAAFVAVGLTLAPRRPVWGFTGLLILSAPLSSSLDFLLGFPLRSLAAVLSSWTLQIAGVTAQADGTLLRAGAQLVEVDAPCSGVRMLWTGLYLTFTLAAFRRLSLSRTALAASAALIVVIAANVLRASALFFLETGSLQAPAFAHNAVGLVAFAMVAAAILRLHEGLRETAA